ncbi:4-hydroxy-tetrahydrodipicolinate reductase [Alteromonas sp. ASW11-36]|uniref:4-hydroxy-tetrahydrodipicolinate reductase n=1 Tax=Alteromonas arenosi TaxID=3055817 RepID=A0ABT7SUG8_9ALTE|nr:4-hydroxy-tetrahydrodipicolinate reductase [Alteromonas sp. ASW11-36]MDM7859838.1 4-hydroxy-tetrahydrodipicolinate reductase [Alteromonas sp. ASW11-36]
MNLAILGANGRMGRALLEAAQSDNELTVTLACVRESSSLVGQSVRQLVNVSAAQVPDFTVFGISDNADVVIDFTLPVALQAHLDICVKMQRPVVIGTTGLSDEQLSAIGAAANHIPIVFAANYSVGVTLMTKLCRMAAQTLGDTADIEIIEAHHRFKRDAPSGTAMAIGEAIADQLDIKLQDHAIYGREGDTGERNQRTIGFSTIRGGDIIGDHTALFADIGERVEITHKASSRQTFALGALRAAKWLLNKPAGLYDMEDVLGLK